MSIIHNKKHEAVYTVLFMVFITIISISLVSALHLMTRDTIDSNISGLKRQKLLSAAGISNYEDDVEVVYHERVAEIRDMSDFVLYYEIYGPNKAEDPYSIERALEGYVIFIRGKGLWGNIDAFVGIEKDRKTLMGIDFIEQNETPGLGARITEPWFRDQFKGKRALNVPEITFVPEGSQADEHQFQAVTGATFTSNTVKYIVNEAINELELRKQKAR